MVRTHVLEPSSARSQAPSAHNTHPQEVAFLNKIKTLALKGKGMPEPTCKFTILSYTLDTEKLKNPLLKLPLSLQMAVAFPVLQMGLIICHQ